jgi:hypothetical protein
MKGRSAIEIRYHDGFSLALLRKSKFIKKTDQKQINATILDFIGIRKIISVPVM